MQNSISTARQMSTAWSRGISAYALLFSLLSIFPETAIQFDGERDTKGPSDFNSNNKADEAADEDDDADDDDSSQKRRDSNKGVKVKPEVSNSSIVPIRPGDVSASPEVSSGWIYALVIAY